MKDKKLISLIRGGERNKAFVEIYKYFPQTQRLVAKMGGTEDDAKDIFQESVIVFYNKALEADFELTAAVKTYLYSVSNNLWLKRLRNNKKVTRLSETYEIKDEHDYGDIDHENTVETSAFAEEVLDSLGEKCKSILKSYYYENNSMKEIASQMGYATDKSAKNQKYKCLERARKLIKGQFGSIKSIIA